MHTSTFFSRRITPLLALLLASTYVSAAEEEALHSFRSLSVEAAAKAAWEAVRDCRKRGYSVAVAVVDRGGNTQALLRDRYAGPHTIETAIRKPGRPTVSVNPHPTSRACCRRGKSRIRYNITPAHCW